MFFISFAACILRTRILPVVKWVNILLAEIITLHILFVCVWQTCLLVYMYIYIFVFDIEKQEFPFFV
jgi:hypothetical protein